MLLGRPARIMFQILVFSISVVLSSTTNNDLSIRTSDRSAIISNLNNKTDTSIISDKSPILISRRLTEGSIEAVFLNITNTEWRIESAGDEAKAPTKFYIQRCLVTSRNPRVARIINSSLIHENDDNNNVVKTIISTNTISPMIFLDLLQQNDEENEKNFGSSLSVQIAGRSVGRTVIDVAVYGYAKKDDAKNSNQRKRSFANNHDNNSRQFPVVGDQQEQHEVRMITSFDVSVLRRSVYNKLSSAFTIFVAIITILTTFLIGTQLEWKIIVKELKKPFSLLVCVGCEFILMPLVSFALALTILRGNYGWQLACLAIGSCPGGGHSPFWTMMLDGNLDLAVAISFVASIAALGVLPFWLFTLGRVFYGGRVTIPYFTITASLFALICPIFVGLAFKHFQPKLADRIGKILKLITVISFLVVGVFGSTVNWYVFVLLDWRHILCGMLLPWSGYFLTYPLSRFIFRRTHQDSLAIGVENGCLNVAVPIVLLQLSLTQPDADLSLAVPFGIVICSSWPLWIYFVVLFVKRRYGQKNSSSKPSADEGTIAAASAPKSTGIGGLESNVVAEQNDSQNKSHVATV